MDHIYQTIPGWCSVAQHKIYSEWARKLPAGSCVVEVGSWMGKSASFMAVEIINSGKDIKFCAVDHWLGSEEHKDHPAVTNNVLFEIYSQNISSVSHVITSIRNTSVEASKQFSDKEVDAIFIDAGHSYEDVFSDISAWLPKLKPGGVIAGDDWDEAEFPGVCKAVTELLGPVEIFDKVWICQLPTEDGQMPHEQFIYNTSNNFKFESDEHLNLFWDRDLTIADTLIISLKNNLKSRLSLQEAKRSCAKISQPCTAFYGYDGTDGKTIKTPDHLKNNTAMKMIKVMDATLSVPEVACFLSHIAAWVHCININRPVVILEHDAIMLKPFTKLSMPNCLEYLGHIGELGNLLGTYKQDEIQAYIDSGKCDVHQDTALIPLTQVINYNYIFARGLHAYAIDPMMARRLFSYVLKYGIVNPADAIIEPHEFSIIQTGVYAVQCLESEETSTIAMTNQVLQGRKDTFTIPGVAR